MTSPRDQLAHALDQSGIAYPEGADFDGLLATFVQAFAIVAAAVPLGVVYAPPSGPPAVAPKPPPPVLA